jgi:YHS domain-containing protein
MLTDPVCGMELAQDEVEATSRYMGNVYYFCSDECREEFDDAPEDYVATGVEYMAED